MSEQRLSRLQKWILMEAYKNTEHPEYGRQVRAIEEKIADEKRRLTRLSEIPFHPGRMRTARRVKVLEGRKQQMLDKGARDGRLHCFVTKRRVYEGFFGLKADQPTWSSSPIGGEKAFLGPGGPSGAKKTIVLSRSLARLKTKGLICTPDGGRFSTEIILTRDGMEKAKSITQIVQAARQFELYNKGPRGKCPEVNMESS